MDQMSGRILAIERKGWFGSKNCDMIENIAAGRAVFGKEGMSDKMQMNQANLQDRQMERREQQQFCANATR